MNWEHAALGVSGNCSRRWIEVWNPPHEPTDDDLVYLCLGHTVDGTGKTIFVITERPIAGEPNGFAALNTALTIAYSASAENPIRFNPDTHQAAMDLDGPAWSTASVRVDRHDFEAKTRGYGANQIGLFATDKYMAAIAAVDAPAQPRPNLTLLDRTLTGYDETPPAA